MQVDCEQQHQQQPDPEAGHRTTESHHDLGEPVSVLPATVGGQDAQGYGDDDTQQRGAHRQQPGGADAAEVQLAHRRVRAEGTSEITSECATEPLEVLHWQRVVQVQLETLGGHGVWWWTVNTSRFQEHHRRVARRQGIEAERDHRDNEQD